MWPNLLIFAALVLVVVDMVNSRPKVSLTHVALLLVCIGLLVPVLIAL